MKNKSVHFAIAIICLILGFSLTIQFRSVMINQKLSSPERMQAQEIQVKLIKEQETNQDLTKQIMQANDDLRSLRDEAGKSSDTAKVLNEQLTRLEIVAGIAAVEGPGVIIKLSDSKLKIDKNVNIDPNYLIIHDYDILRVINELNAAGAEAISINDERYVATSEIRCAGNTIIINGNKYASPFVITAIGDSSRLEAALNMPGGIVEIFRDWNINISVDKQAKIHIGKYVGANVFKYAVPVKKEGNSQ